jgi:hypothetical protein
MIPKASQRGGGQQLATHLLNEFDNDRVQVAEVRGAIAQDLHGAFTEWRAQARATKCRKYLYSLSVNPDPEQGPLTREQYLDFIARTEKQLGLEGQPRALIFHVKHGREHCHAVWSRIDVDRLRAVQLSHDRPKLQTIVRDFARDHGLRVPVGTKDRNADRAAAKRKQENLQEKQQEERTGITKAERVREITKAWRESADAKQFIGALESRGYFLARGDRRAYVVVDRFGEIHSLARYVEGVKTKEVKERLAKAFPLDRLPDSAGAKEYARKKREAQLAFDRDFVRSAESLRAALRDAQAQRRGALDNRRDKLRRQHRAETEALAEAHEDENRGIAATRLIKKRRGLIAFLKKITGIEALVNLRNRRQDRDRDAVQRQQREALARRHGRELEDFQRHYRALGRVEKRELRSLVTRLRREQIQAIWRQPDSSRRDPPTLARIVENARDITEPKRERAGRESAESRSPLDAARSQTRETNDGAGAAGAAKAPSGINTPEDLAAEIERARRQREKQMRARRDKDRDRDR